MPVVVAAFEAYRRDLETAPDRDAFGDADASWLVVAELLARLRAVPPADRAGAAARFVAELDRGDDDPSAATTGDWLGPVRRVATLLLDSSTEALAAELRDLAELMEHAGALRLAHTVLSAVPAVLDALGPRMLGLIVAREARVVRRVGDLDAATTLYRRVRRIGLEHGLAELTAMAALGEGGVARIRGNVPRSRQLYGRALRIALREGHAEFIAQAHQGLFVSAAGARDFDTALAHGWAVLRVAEHPLQRIEMLVNLATLCNDAGFPAAGLRGYQVAASMTKSVRLRLVSLAGAAVSAAELRDRERLHELTRAVEELLAPGGLPYESGQALGLLARAWAVDGPDVVAQEFAARTASLARAHAHHELLHEVAELERVGAARRRAAPLGRDSLRVVRSLETIDRAGLEALAGRRD